jgi:hypothetical protein
MGCVDANNYRLYLYVFQRMTTSAASGSSLPLFIFDVKPRNRAEIELDLGSCWSLKAVYKTCKREY